jgi:hypothetical protein
MADSAATASWRMRTSPSAITFARGAAAAVAFMFVARRMASAATAASGDEMRCTSSAVLPCASRSAAASTWARTLEL